MRATSTRKCSCRTDLAAPLLAALAGLCLFPSHARPAAAATAATPAQPGPAFEEMILEVDLNRQDINRMLLVLRRGDGSFFLRIADLEAFHLKTPSVAPHIRDGEPYVPASAIPEAQIQFDERLQRLTIAAGPLAFTETVAAASTTAAYPAPIIPTTGGFFNYSIDAGYSTGSRVSGALEAGIFGRYGVGVSTFLAEGPGSGGANPGVVRLETTYTRDFPGRHATLRVGDSIVRPGSWGRALHFGGIQYGTNFSTDPGFLTFPTHAVSGTAAVPSLVEVFVNNALVATREVRPGPFAINNIPFVTGSGDVRLVVRDLQNRERAIVVSQPFYSVNTLLKAGLDDYSLEGGALRQDLGIASAHYRDAFAAGTWRRGITDTLTTEARIEASRDARVVGGGATWLQQTLGTIEGVVAFGSGELRSGALTQLGYERQGKLFSLGGRAQWTTPRFRQLGTLQDQPPPRMQLAGSFGLQLGSAGSLTFTGTRQRFREKADLDIATLGYSRSLGEWGSLSLNYVRTHGSDNGYALSAAVTVPVGFNASAAVTQDVSSSGGVRDSGTSLSLQRNRGIDDNYGYRALARAHDIEAEFQYRSNTNNIVLGLARTGSQLAGRAQISGGIGYVGGHAFFSRLITGSFGVVRVADYPDVRVLFDNQLAGRTDAEGYFVLPNMRAYDRNVISVKQEDLPLDASIASLKLDASPYFRSGVFIEFPVKRVRAGVVHILLDNGEPLPSGAVVTVDGQAEEFPTALHGEVYLSGLEGRVKLIATWKEQRCDMQVDYPRTDDPLPDLGTLRCRGVKP